jgi:hypothetical protein
MAHPPLQRPTSATMSASASRESRLMPRTKASPRGRSPEPATSTTSTYKLDLPESSSIHPVFHVSLLKAAPSTKYPLSVDPPESVEGLQVPEAVLQCRLHPRHAGAVVQLLIKWSGMDADLSTWEDAEAIQQRFCMLWPGDMLGHKERGVSRLHTLASSSPRGAPARSPRIIE